MTKKKRTKWTDELVADELKKSMKILGITRMPTRSELVSIGRNDLHCKISKTKKYSGWAKELDLSMKKSETTLGKEYEEVAEKLLKDKGYTVDRMTTKHPYDLLIDERVKIDVKVSNPYLMRGENRVHTIRLAKENQTCDIYMCFLLNEDKNIERVLIVPSHHVRKSCLNIGKNSKYNKYNERYSYIENYATFFKSQ